MNFVTARAKFAASPCGTSNLIALAGENGSGPLTSVEIWNGTSWSAGGNLTDAKTYPGLAAEDVSAPLRFVAAGGDKALGISKVIDTIKASTSGGNDCGSLTIS